MDRRRFLAGGVALGGLVVAGCADDGTTAPAGPTSTSPASPSTTTLPATTTMPATTTVPPTTTVGYDPSRPYWLQGGFAPVPEIGPLADLEVIGAIPPNVNGVFSRNGSNPATGKSPHWFFGDGMVHGIELQDGRASWYANRYLATPLYEEGREFGDFVGPPGGAQTQANVSMLAHGGRLLALGEVGWPYEIDPRDLSTRGPVDITGAAGSLGPNVTAHPKVDPATGLLHFFGYGFTPPYLTYYVASADGTELLVKQDIEVAAGTMIHDFAITERDVVFWEFPVVFDLGAAATGAVNPFRWDASYGSRVGVMPLGGPASDMRWVEIENGYVFHGTNARRDGERIVVDVSRIDSVFDDNDINDVPPRLVRWEIDTAGDDLAWRAEQLSDLPLEFPEIDHRRTGLAHSVAWYTEAIDEPDGNLRFGAIVRRETADGSETRWDPGPLYQPGEAVFVPDSAAAGEGEGWLMTFAWDATTDTSDFIILDATDVAAGPVATVKLPQRVPFGFHGTWLAYANANTGDA
ncbi:MAG: carotenoid oxygenase family protein [Actinomycetota bacterium]